MTTTLAGLRSRAGRGAAMAAAAVLGAAWSVTAPAADDIKLPASMVWSAYDLGSSGYTDASGMANALQTKYKTRIRIVPSGTSIGRLLPMVTGRIQYGYLGNEAYFATEASYDFAAKQWGPQDLRALLGRPSPIGIAMTRCNELGIKSYADLRGKRIGYVQGNPSVNVKNDALLAFGGLTRADIEPVWFGGWGQQVQAVLSGQLDGMNNVPTSGQVRQIEASPGGLCWPPMPPEDKEGWARVKAVASFLEPMAATAGAGLSPEKPIWMAGYRYPIITTYASRSEEEVYQLTMAFHRTFDLYKNATAAAGGWALEKAGRPPYDAPAHEGAIRAMKELGLWRPEDQAWQEARLARLAAVQAAWDDASAKFDELRAEEKKQGKQLNEEGDWVAFWEKYRAEHLDK